MKFENILIIFLLSINLASARIVADIDIPNDYLSVKQGETIYASLKLFNIDGDKRMDYDVKAYVVDENGNKVVEKKKTVAIEKELTTVIEFNLPEYIKPGKYTIEIYLDSKKATVGFTVEREIKESLKFNGLILLIVIIIIFLIIFYISNRKLNKVIKHIKKVDIEDIIKEE